MNKLEYIWISNLDISNKNKFKLIEKFGGITNLYNASLDNLIYSKIKDDISYKVLENGTRDKALIDYEYMMKNKIDIISFEDVEYPLKFNILKDKPVCFYIKGNKKILNNKSIGIVGSRIALTESLEIARLSASTFARDDINIISGLAKGVDKYAHLGALDVSGKTIGIIACGLDRKSFYPQENFKIYQRIIENNGCVISEYPIGTRAKPYYFPYRNRLISSLSDKIFLIQASSIKSGSIITVDYALNQGKDIYVYKSKNIDDTYFQGNKLLIEEGAKILKI